MRNLLLFILFLTGGNLWSQTIVPSDSLKPKVPKSEVKQLAFMADSVMKQLKVLYKKEVNENALNKYQPERIALVRTYILLFDYVQNRCEVATFKKADIIAIFGKPDTVYKHKETQQFELYYNKVIKKYVRIVNLRYRLYFDKGTLMRVRREDIGH